MTLRESLLQLDKLSAEEDDFKDLTTLYESVEPTLTEQDKNELKTIIQSTDDTKSIEDVLTSKLNKNETLEEDVTDDAFIAMKSALLDTLRQFDLNDVEIDVGKFGTYSWSDLAYGIKNGVDDADTVAQLVYAEITTDDIPTKDAQITFKGFADAYDKYHNVDVHELHYVTEEYAFANSELNNRQHELILDLTNDGWEEAGNRSTGKDYYTFFRKLVNGKGTWKAVYINSDTDTAEVIDVTYDQALGYEPINASEKLAMTVRNKLGLGHVIDESVTELSDDIDDEEEDSDYSLVKTKSVRDSDGFMTDYTMYYDIPNRSFIFMFGDTDITEPNRDYSDWTVEFTGNLSNTLKQAYDWFDNYTGFDEDED